jgi:hypothetical protein
MRLEMVMWMPYGWESLEYLAEAEELLTTGFRMTALCPEAEIGRKQLQVAQFGN